MVNNKCLTIAPEAVSLSNKFCIIAFIFLSAFVFPVLSQKEGQPEEILNKEKTSFQTAALWKPGIDIRSDVAIAYGTSTRNYMPFELRLKSWQNKGYTVHFMTGIAWGEYQDYFSGQWDGINHMDEAQMSNGGSIIWHDQGTIPYLVPTASFINYICEKHIKRAIDAGIDAIYLEEPEFWAKAGYSPAFKKEWQNFYGTPWQPQHESPENTYLSNKLKYHLYYNALDKVFSYAKEYGKSKGMNIRCFVPTHSLINYSAWKIVSPEASLASLPSIDGYIAQVWTGTARTNLFFNGIDQECVFEVAFLEYGSMESMTSPTGRKMIFLTDPIDDADSDWSSFKKNYEATFAAQLMYPLIADYEVMPWPERIYEGLYYNPVSKVRELIPRSYSTQMQVMVNALNHMPVSPNRLNGSSGIAVLMGNSLMFQGFPAHTGYDDPKLSNFYGQALPLLKRGIPVQTMHIENVSHPETWVDKKLLIMSYSNMKPLEPEAHNYISDWVKNGGILLYCGSDDDPFQKVKEWWNTDSMNYLAPSGHLFEKLGLTPDAQEGEYSYGKGTVYILRQDPKEFVLEAGADQEFLNIVKNLYENYANAGILEYKNSFFLERGHYIVAAVMDQSINKDPLSLKGLFIDLFDPNLPVLNSKLVVPGKQAFLLNIEKVSNPGKPQVLASAARVYDEEINTNMYSFIAKSPLNTTNTMRVLLPFKPNNVTISKLTGESVNAIKNEWDEQSKTVLLSFDNDPGGIKVEFNMSVGINQSKISAAFSPNPVSDVLKITSPELIKCVSIYSILGNLVQTQNLNAYTTDVNFINMNRGIYLVKVKTENGTIVQKLLKIDL